ncbi:MAG: hypothetical protein JSR82_06500 [Verrucomicrobia bacterium]|nr:hypothetical protein [Verrucomicrobiota bacterium]
MLHLVDASSDVADALKPMSALDQQIRNFVPENGDWRPLELLFEQAFSSADPARYYRAILDLFARYPEEDGAGVFWSAVHGLEAVGGYEELLVESFAATRSPMAKIMLRRLLNAGQSHVGLIAIAPLLD